MAVYRQSVLLEAKLPEGHDHDEKYNSAQLVPFIRFRPNISRKKMIYITSNITARQVLIN
jgi:hypothetical protein